MDRQALVFDQEIYNQFKYKSPRPYFHTFEGDDAQIGLNFADEGEADIFRQTVWLHNSSSRASNFHHRLSRSCWKENKGERRDRHTKSSSSSKVLSPFPLSLILYFARSFSILQSGFAAFFTPTSLQAMVQVFRHPSPWTAWEEVPHCSQTFPRVRTKADSTRLERKGCFISSSSMVHRVLSRLNKEDIGMPTRVFHKWHFAKKKDAIPVCTPHGCI